MRTIARWTIACFAFLALSVSAQEAADPASDPGAAAEPRFFEDAQDPVAVPELPPPTPAPDLPFPPAPMIPGGIAETPLPPSSPPPPSLPVVREEETASVPSPAEPPAPAALTPPEESVPAEAAGTPAMSEAPEAPESPPATPVAAPDAMPSDIVFNPQAVADETEAPVPAAALADESFSDPYYTSIYFGRGSGELSAISESKVRRILPDLMKTVERYPTVIIELAGHTDPFSEKGDVETLSQTRAQILRAYLISQGVPAERIRVRARGSVDPSHTAGDTGRNRRVDVLTYPR